MNLIYLIKTKRTKHTNNFHVLFGLLAIFTLSACSGDPFVEDWNRERLTEFSQSDLEVKICFDRSDHSRKQVEALALQECTTRIEENEKIAQVLELQAAQNQRTAEGRAFRGPVTRQRDIQAQISTLALQYDGNDKWDCPLLAPNRVVYICQYNRNARDSINRSNQALPEIPQPDLPPELPADLKPQ